jgi:putative spermidine/putrescine transport system ATP-binding protein
MADVELRGLEKRYGEVAVVSDLSLRIAHGEFVALLGPSGCGKTTTLQMLAGFLEPSAGEILVGDRPMRGVPPHKRNIGVVFQSYALFPHLDVSGNVAFGLKMRGIDDAEVGRRVRRALDLVRLSALDARYPRELSGGQQQRVALARALVIEPSVLLLDEPLSNLDANLREQMRFEIREIQKRIGITTVFVTHDQHEAMAAADRLVVMSKGRICQVGTAREIYESPADLFVARFIGQANLLPGRLSSSAERTLELTLDDGTRLRAPSGDGLGIGDEATLVLRPEDLSLGTRAPAGDNVLEVEVMQVNYLGSTLHVGARRGGLALSMLLPRDAPAVGEGERVMISWRPDAGILLRGRGVDGR